MSPFLKLVAEAYPLQEAELAPSPIRTTAVLKSYGDQRILIYFGTDSGRVLLFTYSPSLSQPSLLPPPSPLNSPYLKIPFSPSLASSDAFPATSSAESNPKFAFRAGRIVGKSHIQSLSALPEAQRLAVLVDDQVLLLDLHTLGSVELLPSTKGASAIARAFGTIDSLSKGKKGGGSEKGGERSSTQKHLARLFGSGRASGTFALQRKHSNKGNDAEESINASREISEWSSGGEFPCKGVERFAVAARKKLLLFEIRLKARKRTGNKLKSMKARTLTDGEELLEYSSTKLKDIEAMDEVLTMAWLGNVIIAGNYQEYAIFSLVNGQSSTLFSLPQDLLSPPLLKLFPRDLEVVLAIDNIGILVNSIGQPASSSLLFNTAPEAIGQSPPYVVLVKQGVVELYHRKTGTKMQSIALGHTEAGPYVLGDDDSGSYIVVASAEKVFCLERVPLDEQLRELLRQRQFVEAVELAKECMAEEEEEQPKERLSFVHAQAGFLLFFDLQFKEAVDHFLLSDSMQPSEIFPFFPRFTQRWRALIRKNRYYGLHPPPQDLEKVIENKLRATEKKLILHSVTDINANDAVDHKYSLPDTRSKNATPEACKIEAYKQVIRYLKFFRSNPLRAHPKEGIDTLLMKLFIELGSTEEMEELAASDNNCIMEEVENSLRVSGQLRTLARLYESKGMLSLALAIWHISVEGDAEFYKLEREGLTLGMGDFTSAKITISSSQLAAAREASRILESSSDSNLILKHLSWIIIVSRELALQVLCSQKRPKPLPSEDVLGALHPDETYVQQRYLQWLVQDQRIEDTRYHTLYALSLANLALKTAYINNVQGETKLLHLNESSGNTVIENSNCISVTGAHNAHGFETGKKMDKVECSELDIPQVGTSDAVATSEYLSIGNIQNILQEFLESSDMYEAEKVLACIRESELWREQAILYKKLGDEASVFHVLALKLRDTDGAEKYCVQLGKTDAFMRLLNIYLNPGDGMEPMYNAAVHLLHCHGAALDPLQVLEALSPSMPLDLAFQTIARILRARVHQHREGQIVRHLSRAENLEARVARLEERSRHVCITERSICGSCSSRLGMKLFALYPNDSVVCYKCFRHSGEHVDPATGHDFEKDPVFRPSHWLKN